MWDVGLSTGDVEVLKRIVRYLSAIGLHTHGMTVAKSEKLFLEGRLLHPGNARQLALRGTYNPGYFNHTLGKLMILKMRDDRTGIRSGRKAWQAFHDQRFSCGRPPLPMVRRLTLGDSAGEPL